MTDLALILYLELAQEACVDFGLFYYCQGRGVPHDQAYGEMLDQIALAETSTTSLTTRSCPAPT
jgi:hypothetical protein